MTISYSIYESVCLMPLREVSLDALCSPDDENLAFQPASDDHVTIENSVDLKLVAKQVSKFMAGLSDREQFVARSIYWEDANQTRVASALGVSRPMVAKILSRVHRKAKEALCELNPEFV